MATKISEAPHVNGTAPPGSEPIGITAPKFVVLPLSIRGTAPYLQLRFSEKARGTMQEKMEAGSTAKKGKARKPRDFEQDFYDAMHISSEGWPGIPAAAFRNAAIDACRMVDFAMTRAKMCIFIQMDGLDKVDGAPLVKLIGGTPERTEMPVRNASGVADIRVRPMWRQWGVDLRVQFDADQFTATEIVNLFSRAGLQVGIGEGRPFSKKSNGIGYGQFEIINKEQSDA